MAKAQTTNSRTSILEAAARVFSKEGFEGARVDDIAKEACVNKALIYYYFGSKKELLQELFSKMIVDAKRMTKTMANNEELNISKDCLREYFQTTFERHIDFFDKHKDIIKLMLMESLKSSGEKRLLLEFFDILVHEELAVLHQQGIDTKSDDSQRLIIEFFTGLLPTIWFSVYRDEWLEYYQSGDIDIKSQFLNAIWETHIRYHLMQTP